MNKNSTIGIGLVFGVLSLSMIFLLIFAVQDWGGKMEQLKGITAINSDTSTSVNDEYILQKKGFLTDNQVYDFISDCHELDGKLHFMITYPKNFTKTFIDLRCSN